jgi:tetratricopeptide (TPR) repeat protein
MRFGKDLVFQDVDDIKPGKDFLLILREAIKTCKVALILIGPKWLRVKNADGTRRIDHPKDVLRMEIIEALRGRKTVIPVLLGNTVMPTKEELPPPLKSLSRRQAATVSDSRWNSDVHILLERLRELVIPRKGPESLEEAKQEITEKQNEYFTLYPQRPADALELAQKVLDHLDRISPQYPKDPDLQLLRGYFHKNEAMALRDLGRRAEFRKDLVKADRVFSTMIRERPGDAGAWNGKGSVEALRGNFEKALQYIDKALEIDPNYWAAKEDRKEILKYLEAKA